MTTLFMAPLKSLEQEINIDVVFPCRYQDFHLHNIYFAINIPKTSVQYCGGCSVHWGIHQYCGGIASVLWRLLSTVGDSFSTVGDSFSTVEVVQYNISTCRGITSVP